MFQTLQYGFPNKPTALAWDPLLRTMAIGTSTGSIKVYPLTCYFILRLLPQKYVLLIELNVHHIYFQNILSTNLIIYSYFY